MEPHPLDGAWSKLDWAGRKTKKLEADIAASGFEAQPVTFRQEYQPDEGRIVVFIDAVPPTPPDWAHIALDAARNLRIPLNYLATELAKWNLKNEGLNREPDGRTQFPIARKSRDFKRKQVAELHRDHVALIETLQPYDPTHMAQFGTDGRTEEELDHIAFQHPLARLAKLTNTDHHTALQRSAAGAPLIEFGRGKPFDCEIVAVENIVEWTLEPGAPWTVFKIINPGPNPHVEMENRVVTEVAFEDGWPVINTLDNIGITVARILRTFEPVFQPGVANGEYAPVVRQLN